MILSGFYYNSMGFHQNSKVSIEILSSPLRVLLHNFYFLIVFIFNDVSISECKTAPYLEFHAFCRWDHMESDNLLLRVTEEPLKVPEEVLDELFYIGFYKMCIVNSVVFSPRKDWRWNFRHNFRLQQRKSALPCARITIYTRETSFFIFIL